MNAGRWRKRQRHSLLTTLTKKPWCSSATTCCRWATLAPVTAAPSLLGHTPTCYPIRIAGIAIVRQRRCLTTTCCWWAPLSMGLATPRLFAHRPASYPIGESISAIVRICRPHWHHWLNGEYWQHWRNNGWRRRELRRTTLVMDPAAPCLLLWSPGLFSINGAIERITGWYWLAWSDVWPDVWPRRWRRSWRWSGERSWWHRDRLRDRASCSGPGCAASASGSAAIIFLLHGPQGLPISETFLAIKGK